LYHEDMKGMKARWIMADVAELAESLSRNLGISLPLARILANRGLKESREAELFLYGSWLDGPSPFLFKDMARCLERIEKAIENREKILIFGDYDADGLLSLVMLYRALSQMGACVDYYIPDRLKEGYGVKTSHLPLIQQKGARLVITVDCGIKANEFVQLAKEAGIDVIITDHHQPGERIPQALAILNPHLPDSGYPFPHLTGVGVAFKLIQALLSRKNRESLIPYYTKLVAIGTITDIAPLVGENRWLVRHGLKTLAESRNYGLKQLLEVSGLQGERLTEWDIGFRLGPRINAAGRMASAELAVRLFLTESEEEASSLSQKLNQLNYLRQQAEEKILHQVLAKINNRSWPLKYRVFITGCEEWSRGIIGIVATRLKEQFNRPVILFAYENERAYGSGRSIDSFSLIEALRQCQELFDDFGGHHHAAGCILHREKLPELRTRLNNLASSCLSDEALQPKLIIDSPLAFREISGSFLQTYLLLPPFGPGNPLPLFLFSRVKLISRPQFLTGNLTRLKLEQDGRVFEALCELKAEELNFFREGERFDFVASLQLTRFLGEESFILFIEDWASPGA
jgi:single-stranded-DNA-specific exonuclease